MLKWFKKQEKPTHEDVVSTETIKEESPLTDKEKVYEHLKDTLIILNRGFYEYLDTYKETLATLQDYQQKLKEREVSPAQGFGKRSNLNDQCNYLVQRLQDIKKESKVTSTDKKLRRTPDAYIEYIKDKIKACKDLREILTGEYAPLFEKEKYYLSFYIESLDLIVDDNLSIESLIKEKNIEEKILDDLVIKRDFIINKYKHFIAKTEKYSSDKFLLKENKDLESKEMSDKLDAYWENVDIKKYQDMFTSYLINLQKYQVGIENKGRLNDRDLDLLSKYINRDTDSPDKKLIKNISAKDIFDDIRYWGDTMLRENYKWESFQRSLQSECDKYNNSLPEINAQIIIDSCIDVFSVQMTEVFTMISTTTQKLKSLDEKCIEIETLLQDTILYEPPKFDYFIKRCLDISED